MQEQKDPRNNYMGKNFQQSNQYQRPPQQNFRGGRGGFQQPNSNQYIIISNLVDLISITITKKWIHKLICTNNSNHSKILRVCIKIHIIIWVKNQICIINQEWKWVWEIIEKTPSNISK
jgi:hypothetical protein